MDKMDKNWPAWYSSPDGKSSEIFSSADEVPAGWTTGAEKASLKPAKTEKAPLAQTGKSSDEIDAHGHPWSPNLHAASKSKTKAGLWRMAVGKSRPEAKPGYPLNL